VHHDLVRRGLAILTAAAMLAACSSDGPSAAPSNAAATLAPAATPTAPAPTILPTPTAAPSFPLAVVTGLQTLRAVITVEELVALADDGKLVVPCGVAITAPALTAGRTCTPADEIAAAIDVDQDLVALLPPGLVEPATKVLAFAGEGPYGLFGPDLFGDPEARALPYPVQGHADGSAALDDAWTTYDAAKVWTMTSIGSLCSDRYAAKQAVTLKKGWDWVFGGGTAKYKGPPTINPNPPSGISARLYVRPTETGHDGVTAAIQERADLAVLHLRWPAEPAARWEPNPGRGPSVPTPG